MIYLAVVSGVLTCGAAIGAIRAGRLLTAVLWLALASATLSVLLYGLGAREIAVIELSVGAGLVTVLFVFSLALVGEKSLDGQALLPRPLVWVSLLGVISILAWLILRLPDVSPQVSEPSFSITLWHNRGLDVLLQVPLIFAGALGILGLLAEVQPQRNGAATQSEDGDQEMQTEPVAKEEPVEELIQT